MTVTLIEQINRLNDADSVSFLEHFDQMLVNGITNDSDELLASIPASIRELSEFNIVEELAFGETEHELTEQEEIALAKKILEILGQYPVLLPLLEQAWETWKPNDDLGMGELPKNVISIAIAASMVITVAASDVSFDFGIVKGKKIPVPIKDLTELVGQFVKFVPGSVNK